MRTALVLVLSLAALSACGLRGDLVRPVPLWGDPPNEGVSDPRTIKAAEKAKQDAERRAADEERRRQLEQQTTPPAQPTPQ